MIAKRLGAIVLAAVLILGAWVIRDRVIEDGGGGGDSGDDDPPRAASEIVCVEDLRDACDALAETLDLEIRIEDAGTTLDALAALEDPAEAPVWITMEPFPAMADDLRVAAREEPLNAVRAAVASSQIALVVPVDRAEVLATACGEPLRWECVGDAAGKPWSDIGVANDVPNDVRPAFAPIDSALGLLGVADAVSGYFGATPIRVDDLDFTGWASGLADAVPASTQSGGSAIATIQTRSSALDVAVGAAAELSDTALARFERQYADPMIRADVVVAVPEGTSPPSGLTEELPRILAAEGWEGVTIEPNPLPSAREMLAIREAWRAFS